MSQYTKQDTTEEDGRKLFQNSLDSNFFLLNDFAAPSGKDRYPDIDGQIRLRDGNGNYLNRYLHYQLKSTGNLQSEKYHCDGAMLDYIVSTNIPTLLIIADIGNKKVYWFFIDEDQKRKLGLVDNQNSGKTLDLSSHVVDVSSGLQISQLWQHFAKEDDYTKLNDSVSKIASSFHQDIQKCLGLLYLLQSVPKTELVDLFHGLLQIEKSEIETIVQKLIQEGVVSTTANFYLIDNEQLGTESLHKLLTDLNLTSLEETFKDKKDRKRILGQLAKIEHEIAQSYLSKLAVELLEFVKKPTNNDDLFVNLELLHEYAFRVPDKTLEIIRAIITANPLPPTVTELKGFGPLEGKSHLDLVHKSIEILDRIRYREKDVFDVLVDLAKSQESSTRTQSLKVLENISKYNLHILRQIGYGVQMFILERLESWDNNKLGENKDIVILTCKELLDPSFEGTSMQDYRTMTFHSGALNPTSHLIDIRKRAMEVLKRLYSMTQDLVTRKKILITMQEITQTPHTANYGDDMEQMVVSDTNDLIEYYLSILSSSDNDLVKDIDEQTHWFSKRFGLEKLPRLDELKSTIASKTEYDMFKVFVGYDGRFDDDMDWGKAKNIRQEKIQGFIADITESNLPDWETKISAVIKNYSLSEPGEFQYFNIFLFEFAKQKPKLALSLIGKPELEPFLIHLIAGAWGSALQGKAKKIITQWIKTGQHLSISARLFDYVESIDQQLLNKIFKKAKSNKNVQALNNVIASIVRNYPQNKNLKALFIKTIVELTKNNNYWWINNVWYRGETILRDFSEDDFDVILKNLLMLPNIEYHAEEILIPVAEKYPGKIIDFFYKRVLIKSKRERNLDDRYDAVPFNFHKITEPLRQHESVILPLLLAWYGKGDSSSRWLFRWEASHLFEEIFPGFSLALEKSLVDMIGSDQKGALEIAFSVLSKHQGQDFLWRVVRSIVEKCWQDKKYKKIEGSLFGYLSQTGVVSGEYGFVEALQGKKQQLQQCKNDASQAVQAFIKAYENYLDQRIDYEKKRADEDIEFRKREIGD